MIYEKEAVFTQQLPQLLMQNMFATGFVFTMTCFEC